MILAAGSGERMRPLTDITPKPLLEVNGKPLIHYHLERLALAGIDEVVINTCHLAEQIESNIGSGQRWGLNVQYSREAKALETAGGIIQALPILGNAPFIIVNGDIWTDYPFEQLLHYSMDKNSLAHLVMIENPAQHTQGDFYLADNGLLYQHQCDGSISTTYAGIAIYRPEFFEGETDFESSIGQKLPLKPLLLQAMKTQRVSAEFYAGDWLDVGTPERLRQLNESLEES